MIKQYSKLIILTLGFILGINGLQAVTKIDSLELEISNCSEDSVLIRLKYELIKKIQHKDPVRVYFLFEEILESAESTGDLKLLPVVYNDYAIKQIELGDFDKALQYYYKAIEAFRKENNIAGMISTYNNIGSVFDKYNQRENAKKYYLKALELCDPVEKSGYYKSVIYNNLGVLECKHDNYGNSRKFFEKVLEFKRHSGDSIGTARTLINLGVSEMGLGNEANAERYYKEAMKIAERHEYIEILGTALSHLGEIFTNKMQYEEALELENRSLILAKQINDIELIIQNYQHISRIYSLQNNYESALKNYQLSTQFTDSLNNNERAESLNNLEYKLSVHEKQMEQLIHRKEKLELYIYYLLILSVVLMFVAALVFLLTRIWYSNRLENQKLKTLLVRMKTEIIQEVSNGGENENQAGHLQEKKIYQNEPVKESANIVDKNEDKLTPRELEVLELLCAGLSTADISKRLFISKHTVESHRKNLLRKTKSSNSMNLIAYAIRNKKV